jgi:hypothetical protein
MTTIVMYNSNVLPVKYSFTAVIEIIYLISEFVGLVCVMIGSFLLCRIVTNWCNIQDNVT